VVPPSETIFYQISNSWTQNMVNFLFNEIAKEKNVVKEGIKYKKIRQQTS
jgi:hypothetical protein